jgi:hypothetical protein
MKHYKSRKFIITVIAIAAVIICNLLGFNDAITALTIIIPAYLATNAAEHYTNGRGKGDSDESI